MAVSDEREKLIQWHKARGEDEAALAAETFLSPASADPAAPAAPANPAAPTDPPAAPAVPAEAAGPQPPPGKARLRNLDEWEALPPAERMARLDEADALQLEGHR